jgi:bile acid:Na+ symporter, BASS family
MLGLNIGNVLGLLGSGAILAIVVLIAVAVVVGYGLGGPSSETRRVLALGTGQRNLAATFVIATGNFASQPNVLVLLAAAGLVGMILVMPTAAEFGKRTRAAQGADVAGRAPARAGMSAPPATPATG